MMRRWGTIAAVTVVGLVLAPAAHAGLAKSSVLSLGGADVGRSSASGTTASYQLVSIGGKDLAAPVVGQGPALNATLASVCGSTCAVTVLNGDSGTSTCGPPTALGTGSSAAGRLAQVVLPDTISVIVGATNAKDSSCNGPDAGASAVNIHLGDRYSLTDVVALSSAAYCNTAGCSSSATTLLAPGATVPGTPGGPVAASRATP